MQGGIRKTILICNQCSEYLLMSDTSHDHFYRYVDKNRLAAVSTGADLKADISHSRFGRRLDGEWQVGDPDDKFYIMMAQHMIKIENTDMAMHFVKQALDFKSESQVRLRYLL